MSESIAVLTCGHPDRKHAAKGLCASCYMRQHPEYRKRPYVKVSKDRYRRTHREHAKAYGRSYYAANRKRIQQRGRERKYGLSPHAFEALLNAQSGLCPICTTDLPVDHAFIAVDHDHETGKVRGLLHRGCNVAVGMYEKHHGRLAAYLAGK